MSQIPTFALTEEPIVQVHRGGRNKSGRRKPSWSNGKNGGAALCNTQSQVGNSRGYHDLSGLCCLSDLSDDDGSLSYSTSSSVQSHSSAGESTDSSFAEILHVLDLGENAELLGIVLREDDANQQQNQFCSKEAGTKHRSAFSNEADFSHDNRIGLPPSSRSGRPRQKKILG